MVVKKEIKNWKKQNVNKTMSFEQAWERSWPIQHDLSYVIGIAEDKVIDKPATGKNSRTNKNQKPCVEKLFKEQYPTWTARKASFRSNHKKREDKVSIILEKMGSSDYLPEDVWRKII